MLNLTLSIIQQKCFMTEKNIGQIQNRPGCRARKYQKEKLEQDHRTDEAPGRDRENTRLTQYEYRNRSTNTLSHPIPNTKYETNTEIGNVMKAAAPRSVRGAHRTDSQQADSS